MGDFFGVGLVGGFREPIYRLIIVGDEPGFDSWVLGQGVGMEFIALVTAFGSIKFGIGVFE